MDKRNKTEKLDFIISYFENYRYNDKFFYQTINYIEECKILAKERIQLGNK